ncbi:c-type cytochrome [Burkholderia sp. Ac-20379]|uniref:c-type cytochrome n=1 Tax=Burkholderia sp. Ac-20379 TaxID=2703900 RepID=UPI00197EC1BC|nr:c-type cytochrome [Burkholderia sp. Ac-20379]MBN3725122.1 c-type cytochrome [Burkholderia sp. Ac-20379]
MNRLTRTHLRAAAALALALACMTPGVSPAAGDAGADVQAGRALFMKNGCYECHGIVGQGSISTGPALAPHPLPLAAMQAYVHAPTGQMPPFGETILSNADIARIHAYLASLPANPAVADIPLLNDSASSVHAAGTTADADAGRSASIYAANCAGCHGGQGQGGVGPKLAGIGARLSLDGVASRIREPSGIMPKLYPTPLDANDVRAVARYVMSLD